MLPSQIPDAVPVEPVGSELRRAVQDAHAHARATGRVTVVRAHYPVPARDPWDLLGHPALRSRLVAAWADGVDGRAFVAVHPALEATPTGADRFSDAGRIDRALRPRVFDASGDDATPPDPRVPAVVAGFAFSAGRDADGPWADWPDAALWVPRYLLHTHEGRSLLVVADTVSPDASVDDAHARVCRRVRKALALLDRSPEPDDLVAAPSEPQSGHEDRDRAAWHDRVAAARAALSDRAFDKVVLARCEAWRARDGDFDPFATAAALRERQVRCIAFAWRRPDGTAFVGATPEVLVRLSERQVTTVALAGTTRRGKDDDALAHALLHSAKDRHEQRLVIDAIRGALAPVVDDLDIPDEPVVARFADVQHLQTPIRARVPEDRSLFDLAGRLHPTPAVGGLPAGPALAWMQEHEGLDRGWYAGPLGWVDARGDGVLAVAIRSVLLSGDRAWAYAGCGLVPDSDAEAEWNETLTKLRAVRRGLSGTR